MAEDYGESIAATMRNPGTMVFRPNHKMHHGREFMTPVKYQGNTCEYDSLFHFYNWFCIYSYFTFVFSLIICK